MAERKKAQENTHSGSWLADYRTDDVFDRGNENNGAKDMGPVQHFGGFKGRGHDVLPALIY